MLVEAEAIPYEPATLRGERLLVLAPHPDDEVIGCGGLVAQHLGEGRAVQILIATDGTQATGAPSDQGQYRATREEESRRGLEILGGGAEIHFLHFPDRGLDDGVAGVLREHLLSFRPDLVCVPSPVEIHPDHLALSRAFCDLVQRDGSLFADLATTRVAFYEVGQPLRPNTLVDITGVAEKKYAAIAAHASQVALKDYVAYTRGLNAYRAMTLPAETKAAEAYRVTSLPTLRTTPFTELRRDAGQTASAEVVRTEIPISVIIRTKDRPALLGEAVASVRASGYPAEVVVVNDGGAHQVVPDATVVEHDRPQGRSEAMNSGVRAATGTYLAFLDDDDLFYAEHLPTLAAAAAAATNKVAWYTDAVSAFLRLSASGTYETHARQRLFAQDFDRQMLLADNYIPLTTLLVRRDLFLDLGGFDPSFDLFEDWDFLIRLSERGDFVRVPRITCEIRHFESGNSITIAAPEGSERFRRAKLQIWEKHASRVTSEMLAGVLEKQKRRLLALESSLFEEKGRRAHGEVDIARLEREKNELIRQLGTLHESRNEKLMYIQQLEGSMSAYKAAAETAAQESARTRTALEATRAALEATQTEVRATQAEVERLQGLLEMIFRSRTWKLHTLLERLRGRG
ncbi:MAG TPA: PIG-L family deacetylase [Thermoanaerobaculia bacterium]|nr:PIG-L family deacetylase [Thermoanaerobaculia bacterium]